MEIKTLEKLAEKLREIKADDVRMVSFSGKQDKDFHVMDGRTYHVALGCFDVELRSRQYDKSGIVGRDLNLKIVENGEVLAEQEYDTLRDVESRISKGMLKLDSILGDKQEWYQIKRHQRSKTLEKDVYSQFKDMIGAGED